MTNITRSGILLLITTLLFLTSCKVDTLPESTISTNTVPEGIMRFGFNANTDTQELNLVSIDGVAVDALSPQAINPNLAFSYTAGATNTGACGAAASNPSVANGQITVDFCFLNNTTTTFDHFKYRQHVPLTANVTNASHDCAVLPLSTTADTWISGQSNFDDGGNALLSAGEATKPQPFVINYTAPGNVGFYIDVNAVEQVSCASNCGPPAQHYDLANWRIKVPDANGTTYTPTELATLDNEFFYISNGAMVFHAPVDGGTDGSTYPRSELREMIDPANSSVGWSAATGQHSMSASTTITKEPFNGKIVFAQVDGMSTSILAKLMWDNDRIRAQLRQINSDGSTGSYQNHWFAGQSTSFPIGTQFSWDMTVKNGTLFITVNGETVTHDFTPQLTPPAESVYTTDQFYFSAGSQPQDNTLDNAGEAAEVLFHSFNVSHSNLCQ